MTQDNKPLSKEEIMDAVLDRQRIVKYIGFFKMAMSAAMEEYAKQEAIQFTLWNSFIRGYGDQKDMWFDADGECVAQSHEELYTLYLQQKQQS